MTHRFRLEPELAKLILTPLEFSATAMLNMVLAVTQYHKIGLLTKYVSSSLWRAWDVLPVVPLAATIPSMMLLVS